MKRSDIVSKMKGSKVSKRQLKYESLGHLNKIAAKEHTENGYNKFGSFEQRFDKFSKFKKNL